MQRGPALSFFVPIFPQALTAGAEWGMIERNRRASLFDADGVRCGRCPARCLSVLGLGKRAAERKEREKT